MTFLERHADKWEPEPMSGCYIWTGAVRRGSGDYRTPAIWFRQPKRKSLSVRREVLVEKIGSCPPGLQASHTCGNCYCVNPDHLCWETPLQNTSRKTKESRRMLKTTRGCSFKKQIKRWVVAYSSKSVWTYVGCYKTPEEARAAYLAAIEKEA